MLHFLRARWGMAYLRCLFYTRKHLSWLMKCEEACWSRRSFAMFACFFPSWLSIVGALSIFYAEWHMPEPIASFIGRFYGIWRRGLGEVKVPWSPQAVAAWRGLPGPGEDMASGCQCATLPIVLWHLIKPPQVPEAGIWIPLPHCHRRWAFLYKNTWSVVSAVTTENRSPQYHCTPHFTLGQLQGAWEENKLFIAPLRIWEMNLRPE